MSYGHDKYIVMEHKDLGELVIMFPPQFVHSMIARGAERDMDARLVAYPVSAGFVNVDGSAYGESESLGLGSRPEKDTELLRRTYTFRERQ